jgi:predicted metal-binding membrane protein
VQPAPHARLASSGVLPRDRLLVLFGIATITLLSWIYLVNMAGMMTMAAADKVMHAAMGMPEMAEWGWTEFIMLFVMWAVMMAGMMLPSATPVMLLVIGTYRRRGESARWLTVIFAAGYVAAWTAFSGASALTQWWLHRTARLSPDMVTNSALMGASLMLVAGLYQWLPLKRTCLTHCQSPFAFLAKHWREGGAGAFLMGMRHGSYCVGCCWALMTLLFAAGVMNLLWVAAIAGFVLVEKLIPGPLLGRTAGLILVGWGRLDACARTLRGRLGATVAGVAEVGSEQTGRGRYMSLVQPQP